MAACTAVPTPRHPQCSRWQRPKPLQLGDEPPINCWIIVILAGLCSKCCCRAVFRPGFRAGRPWQLLRGAQSLAALSPTWPLLPGPVGFVFGSWRAAEGSSGFGCLAHPLEGSLLILFFLKRINGAAGAAFLGMHGRCSSVSQQGNGEFSGALQSLLGGDAGEATHCSPPRGQG